MIKKVKFNTNSGYIGKKTTESDKPEKPRKGDFRYYTYEHDSNDKFDLKRVFDQKKFDEEMARYKLELEHYNKEKGKYKVECSKNLVGRTFNFSSDKINLIFGPNASGKTTILKAIASYALCNDGFSSVMEPMEFRTSWDAESKDMHKAYADALKTRIKEIYGVPASVDWDGSPIYFHNFSNRKDYGVLGGLTGSIIGSVGEEIAYILDKNKMSSGQDMFYQLSKLVKYMSNPITYEEVLKPFKKKWSNANSAWSTAYQVQEEYYKTFPMAFDHNGQNTYLFDEIDKSMDMLNVYAMYSEILPTLLDKYHQQIIVVSHSPIVLKDEIYNSDKYNFISMNEEYTNECRKLIS